MFKNREGQRVPQVTFRARSESDWKPVTTDDIFKGKTVVVFSLPGAFTPTCSSTHVPRYNELAPAFLANGVDRIVCVSVNDAFVMNEWARTQECGNILMLPDGNGEFTEKMGMLVDKTDLGFGKRSWRYSMLVKDGVIEKMFIEPEKPGDPFEVSDADTMLELHQPEGEEARPGGDPHARRLRLLRQGEEAAEGPRLPVQRSARSTTATARASSARSPAAAPCRRCSSTASTSAGSEELERWAKKAA